MKGGVTLKILERVGEVGIELAELFDAILEAGYGASFSKIQYTRNKRLAERECSRASAQETARLHQRYATLLYKLKRDGLLQESQRGEGRFLALTRKGVKALLRLRKRSALPSSRHYTKEQGKALTIVSFDVPEKERQKRDWLRSALLHLGLTMVQKSVWIGTTKIPQQFLKDLRQLRLIEYVEIFSVSKTGSLK